VLAAGTSLVSGEMIGSETGGARGRCVVLPGLSAMLLLLLAAGRGREKRLRRRDALLMTRGDVNRPFGLPSTSRSILCCLIDFRAVLVLCRAAAEVAGTVGPYPRLFSHARKMWESKERIIAVYGGSQAPDVLFMARVTTETQPRRARQSVDTLRALIANL